MYIFFVLILRPTFLRWQNLYADATIYIREKVLMATEIIFVDKNFSRHEYDNIFGQRKKKCRHNLNDVFWTLVNNFFLLIKVKILVMSC